MITGLLELASVAPLYMYGANSESGKPFYTMRLEGNTIRVDLESCIRDTATNARFVATLPPIVGLVDSVAGNDSEGEAVWRERLTTIFRGRLRSNPDFQVPTYSRVVGDQAIELVRVDQHG